MRLLISNVLIPSWTLVITRDLESQNNLPGVALQPDLFFFFTKSRNICIIGLMEYIEAIWFTKPNHDGAPVMSLGTAKSAIAASIFG